MSTYGRLCTEFYDLSKAEAPPEALAFFLDCLEDASQPVLEPMCGSGRFLVPFLERGIDIDGVDSSPHMLQACHDHCEARALHPALYQQRLQELSLSRYYGYVFIPAGSFGLITDSRDAAEALRRLYRHLAPGGRLAIEIETPRALPESLGEWHESRLTRGDGAEVVFRALPQYDPATRVQQDTHWYGVFDNGSLIGWEVEDLSLRLYEQAEFSQLLEAAGFTGIRATRPYSDVEPQAEDAAIVFRCQGP